LEGKRARGSITVSLLVAGLPEGEGTIRRESGTVHERGDVGESVQLEGRKKRPKKTISFYEIAKWEMNQRLRGGKPKWAGERPGRGACVGFTPEGVLPQLKKKHPDGEHGTQKGDRKGVTWQMKERFGHWCGIVKTKGNMKGLEGRP